MKFRPSTHSEFELEAIKDQMFFLTGYSNTTEKLKEFLAKNKDAIPYVFKLDRDFNVISSTPGILTWEHAYPDWTCINNGDELVKILCKKIEENHLNYESMIEFINKFHFGIKSELNIYKDLEVKQINKESVQYGSYYQGVKLI